MKSYHKVPFYGVYMKACNNMSDYIGNLYIWWKKNSAKKNYPSSNEE